MISPQRALVAALLALAALAIPVTASATELPGSGTLTWSVPFDVQ
ncbi:MAG TPA: hypothetical protein VJ870_03555 [Amycolatopsis sp.]|nr:hypothetical protein [Amycolatopsis sp.]